MCQSSVYQRCCDIAKIQRGQKHLIYYTDHYLSRIIYIIPGCCLLMIMIMSTLTKYHFEVCLTMLEYHHNYDDVKISIMTILKSMVPDQNGVSLLYIMLEIHHSGREPSKYHNYANIDIGSIYVFIKVFQDIFLSVEMGQVAFRGFQTRMVYLDNITCLGYTILAPEPSTYFPG